MYIQVHARDGRDHDDARVPHARARDANYSSKSVETNAAKYDPLSPLLCGQVQDDDKITIRKVGSLKETQLSIFDM